MKIQPNRLNIGYDLDTWNRVKMKVPITTDISPATNSHILLSGMSGSGKSFMLNIIFSKLTKQGGEFYFADYKGDDSFAHLRGLPHYYSFQDTLEALDIVYSRLNERLSGEDTSRKQITLIYDEYMANILTLMNEDKKKAGEVMSRISEILLMGRSMGVRLIASMQRPDALAFPAGSRLNFGVVIVLGAAINSIYEMLIPDFINLAEGRRFNRGEGAVVFQGSKLKFIKVGVPKDYNKLQKVCIKALS
jgi:hypothetical protein